MRLDEHYTLEADVNSWVLKKRIKKKDGKISRDHWYYPKIEQALKKYFDESLKRSESVDGVYKEIEKAISNIEMMVKK